MPFQPGAKGQNGPKVERKPFSRINGERLAYTRVSTSKQDGDYQRLLCAGADVPSANIYIDTYTGRSMDRAVFKKMDARLRPGDTLVVTELHRVGRCDEAAQYLIDLYMKRGVNFEILNVPFLSPNANDLDPAIRNSLIWTFAYVGKEFIKGLSFNTTSGMYTLTQTQGMKPGRKPINPETAGLIRKYADEGWSKAKIGRTFNLGRTTVSKYIRDRDYNPLPPRLADSTIARRAARGELVVKDTVRTHQDRRKSPAQRNGHTSTQNGYVPEQRFPADAEYTFQL